MRSPTMLSVAILAASACASQPPLPTRVAATPSAPASETPRDDALAVSGLRGTLSQHEIQRTLEPKLPKFLRCANQRRADLELLAGALTIRFNVALDGSVVNVQPVQTTLGDRETERCMLDVAEQARFPAPHGGEAEFTWPLELPPDPELRPAVELLPDPSREPLLQAGKQVHAACGGGLVIVTAYLDPSGKVLAAGVGAPELATPAELDCIAQGVRGLTFDSPGSYVGKLSFPLP